MGIKELAEVLAKALVDDAEAVRVAEATGQQVTVIEIRVAKEDIGKIIGREGKLAQALRTVLSCAAAKDRRRIILNILE